MAALAFYGVERGLAVVAGAGNVALVSGLMVPFETTWIALGGYLSMAAQ